MGADNTKSLYSWWERFCHGSFSFRGSENVSHEREQCVPAFSAADSASFCPASAAFVSLLSQTAAVMSLTFYCQWIQVATADTWMCSELLLLLSLSYVFCLFAWFEALTATESDGTLLMEQYVPCHICAASRLEDECGEKAEDAQYFNMEDCVLTAIELDYITCPNHPDIPVSLQELVPELFMTDFPAR